MSGIAGILYLDGGAPEKERLERMLQALKQRGPHGQDLHIEGAVGLGCTRLHLTSRNHERTTCPDSRLPVVFDGRLDNRADLIARLKPGQPPLSDAALILAAYEKWGENCPRHLLGDFAFALWDRRENRLFCARDHFGVKPFYYHHAKHFFVFASSPYAILAAHRELCEINEARIADFLVDFEGIDETVTFYQRIFRLPRGRSLTVDLHGTREVSYRELQPVQTECRNENEYVEAFREIFEEAVKCRLGTPDETVVPLSGGLDSTSIAAVARQEFQRNNDTLMTLSAITGEQDDSETNRIRAVLAQGGHRSGIYSEDFVLAHLDELTGHLARADEPFDCLENSWRATYRQATENHVHVSLDGVDADVTLSGSNHIRTLWKSRQYRAFLGETLMADGLIRTYYRHPCLWFMKSLRSVLAPDWLRGVRREFSHRSFATRVKSNSLISTDLAQRINLVERHRRYSAHGSSGSATMSPVKSHKKNLLHPHLQAALERYDRIAAAFSIEARHPFFDVRLVEFCLDLPWQLKTHRGWTKMILRKVMEPVLPQEVTWGDEKKHPNWALSLKLLKTQERFFKDVLDTERQHIDNYIDINRLNSACNEFFVQNMDKRTNFIWDAIGLAFWLRRQRQHLFDCT